MARGPASCQPTVGPGGQKGGGPASDQSNALLCEGGEHQGLACRPIDCPALRRRGRELRRRRSERRMWGLRRWGLRRCGLARRPDDFVGDIYQRGFYDQGCEPADDVLGAWEHRHELEVSKSLGTPLKARYLEWRDSCHDRDS